jgi:hypothetical protein
MDNNPVAPHPEPHLVRKITRFLFGSWAAWIYLAVVAASIVFAVVSVATDTGEGANLAGVWPFFATMPWSLVFIGVIVVSALANLATIGALMHVIRRAPAAPRQSGPPPTAFPTA